MRGRARGHGAKVVALALAAGAIATAARGQAAEAPAGAGTARPLASIDGERISSAVLARAAAGMGERGKKALANPVLRRQLLDSLIESRLLAKAAEAAGVGRGPEFQELLAEARVQILAGLYAKQYVRDRTGDAQQRAYFAKDPARFSAKEVRASHILVRDEAAARRVLAEVTAPGADFAAVARRYASGTDTGTQGGDLGFFRRGRMLPEFDQVAFTLAKDQIAPAPVKTAFGWHVLKVTDIRGDDHVRFADVKDQVRDALEQLTRAELLAQLRSRATVVVDDGAVRQMPLGH